jgi:NDP-sugar pyrophosphorylase family protein
VAPVGLVLAAGLGTRLRPLTDDVPKCLTKVSGRPILLRALDRFRALGVEHCVCVVGYRSEQVRSGLAGAPPGMRITVVHAPEYWRRGTAASLQHGLAEVPRDADVLLAEGDVVFEGGVVERLLAVPASATAVATRVPNCQGTFLGVGGDGLVSSVHRAHHAGGRHDSHLGKAVNLHLLGAQDLTVRLRPLLRSLLSSNPAASVEDLLEEWLGRGGRLRAVDVGPLRWWEVDDARDLRTAELLFSDPDPVTRTLPGLRCPDGS